MFEREVKVERLLDINMKKRLKVKNDFIFQRLFGRQENKDILISLLNAILQLGEGYQIDEIELIENTKLEKDRIEDKQGILDIRAQAKDGTQLNIEIQLINQYNMDKRTLFYWAKLFADQLNPGQSFRELKKTITINILDFNYVELTKYHTIFHLREDIETEYKLTDVLQIHFLELPKFRKLQADMNKPLERWLSFMEPSSEEVLEMIKDQDPSIAKAEKILDWLGTDKETLRLYEIREKAIHDEVTRLQGAKEEGIKEGIKEGEMKKAMETAKAALTKGIAKDVIADITGLKIEQIEKLQKEYIH